MALISQSFTSLNLLHRLAILPRCKIVAAYANSHKQNLHTSQVRCRVSVGRYKPTKARDFPLTYEMAQKPHDIAHSKSWLSWNTSNLYGGFRASEIAVEDMFIRKFMSGTFHNIVISEVIIKRRFNMIVIATIIQQSVLPRKVYFLIGFAEELLSHYLKSIVKLELQSVSERKDIVFTYV